MPCVSLKEDCSFSGIDFPVDSEALLTSPILKLRAPGETVPHQTVTSSKYQDLQEISDVF
jgi:hypothetical protein